MGGVFAGRVSTVVAAITTPCNIAVIEAGRYPGNSTVTVITTCIGSDMAGRFAFGNRSIVTGHAGTQNGTVVHCCLLPGKSGMAVITIVITNNMFVMFTRGHSAIMATSARCRCSFKNGLNMTGFTSHADVFARQRKACGEMVKLFGQCRCGMAVDDSRNH